jgi:SAM-dependent methyltransferase
LDRERWNETHEAYNDHVVSVFDHDPEGLICDQIENASTRSNASTAADLGCGIGNFCPTLAQRFTCVHACDFSATGLDLAQKNCESFGNIHYHELDLSSDELPFAPVDLALCVNVLIMPDLDLRMRAWRAVTNQIKSGGRLLLVVPSLESIAYNNWQQIDQSLLDGRTIPQALNDSFPSGTHALNLHQGVHLLDEVPTKHYTSDELKHMLNSSEFDVREIARINYEHHDTTTDFVLNSWDWLVVASRR